MPKERIGIMGGTLNPVHRGHIAMALAAMESASLDRVLFLPDGQPPHKAGIAPAEDRWRMLVAATAGLKHVEPCRMELDRPGTTYTYDTLTSLREQFPKAALYYIIGADTLMQLKNWYRWEEVLPLCTFLVCPREFGGDREEIRAERERLEGLGARFKPVRMDVMDVSSSGLREALARGEDTPLLPAQVREYCGLMGLYGMTPAVPEAAAWMPRLFGDLSPKRFAHTLGVVCSARELALAHGADLRSAMTAALLHDCAKCLPLKEMQRIARENRLTEDPEIMDSGALLHAPVGAWMAEHVYGVTDPEILSAIAVHTTGCPGMGTLDMVVFLADKIEPGRPGFPLLARMRETAPRSLPGAMCLSLEGTADYVKESGRKLHPRSAETLAWVKSVLKESK